MSNRNRNLFKGIVKKGTVVCLSAAMVGGLALTGISAETKDNDKVTLTYALTDNVEEDKGEELSLTDIVEKTMPAVVSLTVMSIQEVEDYYSMFGFGNYAPIQEEVEGGGSGVIVGKNDTELLILTNAHVIEDAETVTVTFADNETYEAKVKGEDEDMDIGIVAVQLDDISDDTLNAITIMKIGDSDSLKIGEQILVEGNAMGYGQSVTTGIVSGKNRSMNENEWGVEDVNNEEGVHLIQTDAAINPGNSGGAIVNMKGELVGIANSKLANTLIEGMCYGVAISDVDEELENIMNQKTRDLLEDDDHGVLNIVATTVTEEENAKYGIPFGAYVLEVNEGGAADKAGLEPNSIITEFDGRSVDSVNELIDILAYYEPGEEVEMTVLTQNGREYDTDTVTVTLGAQEEEEDTEDSDEEEKPEKHGKRDDADDEEDASDDQEDSEDKSEKKENRSREDIFEDWENGIFE